MRGHAAISELKPADLPAPPQAAARIVQACSNPKVGARALADIVARDPILTAELLRTVNSAFYALKCEVKSAAHAVTVLGNRALRNIALCLAVRDALKPDAIPGFDMLAYWEDALRRAVASKRLASVVGVDGDDAFTVGLLQDFGLLAMFFAMPEHAEAWGDFRTALPDGRRKLEQRSFGITHDKVGLMLARTWSLPASIALPMACHHALDTIGGLQPEHRRACQIANGADWLAAVFAAEDKAAAVAGCRTGLESTLELSPEQIDHVLDGIPDGVEEAASSLGLRVEVQPRLDDIMRQASRRLVVENTSYQELTWQLQRTIAEKEALEAKLREANEQLAQLAYFDALTGLMNRRRFQDSFRAEVTRHSRSGLPLSVVMVDLDHFKSINDNYGHPFGDTVLEAVAEALRSTLRASDIKARIGGEEMCLVLPESDRGNAMDAVERVRRAIEALELHFGSQRVIVTASFGCSTWAGDLNSSSDVEAVVKRLMDRADEALYGAKRSGRNRGQWAPYADRIAA